jgi:hypothetical protein
MRLEENVPYFPRVTILKDVSGSYGSSDGNELLTLVLVDTHVFGTICMTLRESDGSRKTTQALGSTSESIVDIRGASSQCWIYIRRDCMSIESQGDMAACYGSMLMVSVSQPCCLSNLFFFSSVDMGKKVLSLLAFSPSRLFSPSQPQRALRPP